MPFYLNYVAAGGKYMQMPATPTPFGVVASAQNFKLTINIKCVGANPIVLGSTVDDSSVTFQSATTLSIKQSSGTQALYTIPSNTTDFRIFEFSRTDGANVALSIDGALIDTKPLSGGMIFNRLFASLLGVSPASAQLKYIKLEKDSVLAYNWENTTGTGTQMPDTVGARPFNQIGTWPADNSEWVEYSDGGTTPTGTVTIGTITKTSTTATIPYTYSAADQTGFEYRLNGGATVADAASPVDLTGLTASTAYTIEVRAVNASGQGAWSAVANFTTDAGGDTTPPAFTVAPAVTGITQTTGTATATINETGNIYYVVVPQADATPSVAQVKAGQNASGTAPTDSGSALATTALSDGITGLTAGTAYKACFVAEDDELTPNIQAAVTTVNFTTSAVAVGTITISNIAQNNNVKWSSTAIDAAAVMPVGLGSVVVSKTGLTTTAGTSPGVTFSDAAIVTGTEYIIILKIGTAYGWYRTTAT
jgi:hypothetical protein